MEGVKIYGLCLERLRHQIRNAKDRIGRGNGNGDATNRVLLESYCTGDMDEIVDVLELYDIDEKTSAQVQEKLEDLAYTVSVLIREQIAFGLTPEGHLGLYWVIKEEEEAYIPRR